MLYTILSDVMTFSEDQAAVMTLDGRKDAEQLLWAELNKKQGEKTALLFILLFQIKLIYTCFLGCKSLYRFNSTLAAALGSITVGGMADAQTVGSVQTEAVLLRLVKIDLPLGTGKRSALFESGVLCFCLCRISDNAVDTRGDRGLRGIDL